jgi:hypothetical protein
MPGCAHRRRQVRRSACRFSARSGDFTRILGRVVALHKIGKSSERLHRVASIKSSLAPFQAPGTQQGTLGVGINGFGVIDVRTTCTDTPNPPADCAFECTFPVNVNVLGRVGGTYYAEDGNPHGFWRDADGTITRFDYPGANYLRPQSGGSRPRGDAIAGFSGGASCGHRAARPGP